MSPSPPGGPAAHRVAIISFPVTKETQILWSPHRGREGTGGGSQRQSHSGTPGEARPAQPRAGDGGWPLHAVAIGKRTGTTLGFSYAPRLLPSWLEEREQMCQSSARGRRRLRRPSLVRLIAPTRHLPLPPAPPIQSPSRGEERASGERREVSAPSYFATRRRRERGRSSAVRAAPAGGGGRAAPRLGPAEL